MSYVSAFKYLGIIEDAHWVLGGLLEDILDCHNEPTF